MFKVCGSLDLSVDDLKKCIQGAEMLSACINYDRVKENKSWVFIDEAYFVQYAIRRTLDVLENEVKKFEEN